MAGPRRLFTDQQLKELHERGFNDRKIADMLRESHRRVADRRRILGLKVHDRRYTRLFTDQHLIELHEQGFNDREISEKLGVHLSTVNYRRKRLGLKPIRKHGARS
jgi:orotate phosphoribosyltransferase-like protein